MDESVQRDQVDTTGLSWSVTSVERQSFRTALAGTVTIPAANPWDQQLSIKTTDRVAKGDQLLAVFSVRGKGQFTPDATGQLLFEAAGGTFEKSVEFDFSVGNDWKIFYIPFKSTSDFAAGEAHVTVRLGFAAQTVEFGAVEVYDYGQTPPANLPMTRFDYDGRSADAPWRVAAQARIEKLRKADFALTVVDSANKPIPDAVVTVAMQRHAFKFGTEVGAAPLLDADWPGGEEYRRQLVRLFNYGTPGNALKWPLYEIDSAPADAMVNWLCAHGISVRGHNLIWPSWKPWYVPARIKDGYEQRMNQNPADAKAWLAEQCAKRVTQATTHFAGKIADWDVVNEPYSEHDLLDILGPTAMPQWYRLAKVGDPKANLFLNDYAILEGGGNDQRHQDSFFNHLKALKDAGAPIEGIGIQGHWGWLPTAPEKMLKILDRFGTLDLPIQITEFDMNITDEQLQADFTRDLLITVFSHPKVEGFIMWGFWEKAHWLPNSAMYRADWTPKPNGKVYEDLVLHQWWTRLSGKTDVSGKYTGRAFRGDYEISVTAGDRKVSQHVRIDNPSAATLVQLKLP